MPVQKAVFVVINCSYEYLKKDVLIKVEIKVYYQVTLNIKITFYN